MKSLFLCTAGVLCSLICFGQPVFGITGGLNLANQRLHESAGGQSAGRSGSNILSFQVGGFADLPLSANFAVNPEILLSGEGSNFSDAVTGESVQPRVYYLRVPLNLNYVSDVPGGAKFYIGAGPDFGFGLFGNTMVAGQSTKSFQDSLFKKFDFGVNFVSGVQLASGFRISINYYLGISSIATSTFTNFLTGSGQGIDSFAWRNGVLSLSLGFALNMNPKK
ncbi:MAG TPA: porin family protein [Puia sp.]|nr:porin family protein [Puia sp.]